MHCIAMDEHRKDKSPQLKSLSDRVGVLCLEVVHRANPWVSLLVLCLLVGGHEEKHANTGQHVEHRQGHQMETREEHIQTLLAPMARGRLSRLIARSEDLLPFLSFEVFQRPHFTSLIFEL